MSWEKILEVILLEEDSWSVRLLEINTPMYEVSDHFDISLFKYCPGSLQNFPDLILGKGELLSSLENFYLIADLVL